MGIRQRLVQSQRRRRRRRIQSQYPPLLGFLNAGTGTTTLPSDYITPEGQALHPLAVQLPRRRRSKRRSKHMLILYLLGGGPAIYFRRTRIRTGIHQGEPTEAFAPYCMLASNMSKAFRLFTAVTRTEAQRIWLANNNYTVFRALSGPVTGHTEVKTNSHIVRQASPAEEDLAAARPTTSPDGRGPPP